MALRCLQNRLVRCGDRLIFMTVADSVNHRSIVGSQLLYCDRVFAVNVLKLTRSVRFQTRFKHDHIKKPVIYPSEFTLLCP